MSSMAWTSHEREASFESVGIRLTLFSDASSPEWWHGDQIMAPEHWRDGLPVAKRPFTAWSRHQSHPPRPISRTSEAL
ncbi:hypothetical protein SAMN02787142_8207 [Burkholderia sp. WP9]|nr:hypothetical protein SAMN02787142_8207 [Burkholderia sp. WP9]